MKKKTTVSAVAPDHRDNDGYPEFSASIQRAYQSAPGPLFTTDAANLWTVFYNNLPEHARQHYNCRTCQRFIEQFGGLVRIGSEGQKRPAVWAESGIPEFFQPAVTALRREVTRAKVAGVFISSKPVYGVEATRDHKGREDWQHMSIRADRADIWKHSLLSDTQKAAERVEEFGMLIRGLVEYPIDAVFQALKLLRSESLYRSENCLGIAEWLKKLHGDRARTKSKAQRENLTWLAVATAPAGWCHVKTSMIGTLLDDIVAGHDFDVISRKFREKMSPIQYQRPQAAPTGGAIKNAEVVFEKMGCAKSLERRFAVLNEIEAVWQSTEAEESKSDGLFSHIKAKNASKAASDIIPASVSITFDKFSKSVLPNARSIRIYAPSRGDYAAILTAVHNDAPPIIQWDVPESRNPFSWYLYHNGSPASRWGVSSGWVDVSAVCLSPSNWGGRKDDRLSGVIFVISGAKDSNYKSAGNALFPEILKSEFHAVRSVIEAYSKTAEIQGYDTASACGLIGIGAKLLVKTDLGIEAYTIDRMD